MRKPFDTLYTALEKSLDTLGRERAGMDRYHRGIVMIRERISDMRTTGRKFVRGRETEIAYFREVWPIFYGQLFHYILLYRFELNRQTRPGDAWLGLIGQEEFRVSRFFRANGEFWSYYRSGAAVQDEQFTRAYSQARVFDPLALVIDGEATLASYTAARCLAMEAYGKWLSQERERLTGPKFAATDYTWGPADTDFVEWLFGLSAVGAIRYKGQPADISRLVKWARWALGKEVINIHDRFKVLRNRKKERMAFTKRTTAALEKRMDQAEGKTG